jgi:hypothetical protein
MKNLPNFGLNFLKLEQSQFWFLSFFLKKTSGVSHYGLAIYIQKYLQGKEELWKLKYFTMQKY